MKQKKTSVLSTFDKAGTVVVLSATATDESLKSLIEALKPWFSQSQTLHLITFAKQKKLNNPSDLPPHFHFKILQPSDFFFFGWPKKRARALASAAGKVDLILNLDPSGNPRMQYLGSTIEYGFVAGLGSAGQETINDFTLEIKNKLNYKEVLAQLNHYLESLNGNIHA